MRSQRGMALLEVIVALGILVLVAGALVGALHSSIRRATQLRIEAQAMDLAVTVLSEIHLGTVTAMDQGPTGEEGENPDWTWQVRTLEEQTGSEGGGTQTIEVAVTHRPSGYVLRMTDVVPVGMAAAGGVVAAP